MGVGKGDGVAVGDTAVALAVLWGWGAVTVCCAGVRVGGRVVLVSTATMFSKTARVGKGSNEVQEVKSK